MTPSDEQLFKRYLKKDWYIQGFSAVPVFLSIAVMSGIYMKKFLGFNYKHFLFNYHRGYAELAYDPQDFKRIYRLIKNKLSHQSGYLKIIKREYRQRLIANQPLLKQVSLLNLKSLTDHELLKLFKKISLIQCDTVGVAHILEAISVEIEKEFRDKLRQEKADLNWQEFNKLFSDLIISSRPSFVSQEEQELLAIKGGLKNTAAFQKHALKYSWLANSYSGAQVLSVDYFKKKFRELAKEKRKNISKKEILLNHRLSIELKRMVKLIDYCTIWQDERKVLIFQDIGYMDILIQEIARRLNWSAGPLYYLGFREILGLRSLAAIKKLIPKLRERRQGCLILINRRIDKIISGSEYRRLMAGRTGLLEGRHEQGSDLHGTAANIGTARGPVRIIKNIQSLNNFLPGEILVASMTRPEFMPAIKKAAAIVTDEGGVTCHAAIIARELNIPTVIGTKIATKILRNGMLVEVKANYGLIKILDN